MVNLGVARVEALFSEVKYIELRLKMLGVIEPGATIYPRSPMNEPTAH